MAPAGESLDHASSLKASLSGSAACALRVPFRRQMEAEDGPDAHFLSRHAQVGLSVFVLMFFQARPAPLLVSLARHPISRLRSPGRARPDGRGRR